MDIENLENYLKKPETVIVMIADENHPDDMHSFEIGALEPKQIKAELNKQLPGSVFAGMLAEDLEKMSNDDKAREFEALSAKAGVYQLALVSLSKFLQRKIISTGDGLQHIVDQQNVGIQMMSRQADTLKDEADLLRTKLAEQIDITRLTESEVEYQKGIVQRLEEEKVNLSKQLASACKDYSDLKKATALQARGDRPPSRFSRLWRSCLPSRRQAPA